MEQLANIFNDLVEAPALRIIFIMLGAIIAVFIARYILARMITYAGEKTKSDIDDQILKVLNRPVIYSIVLAGIAWVVSDLDLNPTAYFVTMGIIKTIVVFILGFAASRVGTIILETLARKVDSGSWIQPKSFPLFDILLKVLIIGGALYFIFVAWNINLTSWLASAGIIGIAVGFAAKDTLANLFAGIFIIADAPYKIGDFIILDDGIRGIVTDIGTRSTRLLTRDDVEVTLPNSVIANSKIVNETGGPHQKMRVRVQVSAAYGSDVDKVREVLLSCSKDVKHLSDQPTPRVRFREFGNSGLLFELLAWIDEPVYRGRVLDELNTNVYKAFNNAKIEIPYSKHDVYIKQEPVRAATGAQIN